MCIRDRKQAAQKEDLAKEMLQMLVDYIPEVNDVIELALKNKSDIDTLTHHIHKLHGSCSYCGVPKLKNICMTVEKSLRTGVDVDDIEPELFELQDEMLRVKEAAIGYL